MRIASHPLLIPPYVMKEAERKVQPADRAISVTQVPGQPFGAPLYRVALAGYTLSAPRTDWNPVVDVLRNVSTMVAEHCGIRGVKIATAVIWLINVHSFSSLPRHPLIRVRPPIPIPVVNCICTFRSCR